MLVGNLLSSNLTLAVEAGIHSRVYTVIAIPQTAGHIVLLALRLYVSMIIFDFTSCLYEYSLFSPTLEVCHTTGYVYQTSPASVQFIPVARRAIWRGRNSS